MPKRNVLLYIFVAIINVVLILLCIYFGTTVTPERRNLTVPVLQEQSDQSIVDDADQCSYTVDDFNRIIRGISRGLDFFSTELHVDSGAGTRALQGQLEIILQNFTLPAKIRSQLKQLLRNVTDTGDRIMENVVNLMENDQSSAGKENLRQCLYWIESGSLWAMPAAGHWQEKDALDLKRYAVLDENDVVYSGTDFPDRCITAVFNNCTVPHDCFDLFLGKRYSEYLITHSILFLLSAEKRKCFEVEEYMEKLTRLGNPNDIVASFCAKVYREAEDIEKAGWAAESRDLFSEQVYVCSMSGFKQFLHIPWLRTVLSWQSEELLGCFALAKHAVEIWEETYNVIKESPRDKRDGNVIETEQTYGST